MATSRLLVVFYCLLFSISPQLSRVQALRLSPFRTFKFAGNSVCAQPCTFYVPSATDRREMEFGLRNVPGDGDCMFLAVALATATSMGLGANDALLRTIAAETRAVVAQVLGAPEGNLHIEKQRIVRAADLLSSAAKQEGLLEAEYLDQLRQGHLQGGGPELTVLANVLRRPISIYELDLGHNSHVKECSSDRFPIKLAGSFGDIFEDPCLKFPNSAVLSGLEAGAYCWHLYILVVDSGGGAKHACALLPRFCVTGSPPPIEQLAS